MMCNLFYQLNDFFETVIFEAYDPSEINNSEEAFWAIYLLRRIKTSSPSEAFYLYISVKALKNVSNMGIKRRALQSTFWMCYLERDPLCSSSLTVSCSFREEFPPGQFVNMKRTTASRLWGYVRTGLHVASHRAAWIHMCVCVCDGPVLQTLTFP